MRRRFLSSSFAYSARCLALGLGAVLVHGQSSPPVTFHAYTNLLQIPVLVVSPSLKPLPHISDSRFAVSLDAGPKFRPTHVRLEGDDPIALSILLDVSESDTGLLPGIDELIAGLSPEFLRQSDHVSIYALDCAVKRFLYDGPADRTQLKEGVNAVLQSWKSRAGRSPAQCEKTVHIWDALAIIAKNMSSLPGRRVILAVTDGQDNGSVNNWNSVRLFADVNGIAIFGISRRGPRSSEDAFQFICSGTGGVVLPAKSSNVLLELERFMTMLRERYIIEFPRTDSATSGPHSFDVTVANSNALIRSTGLSVPIADPGILADPSTVPNDPSRAPQYGKRRILTPE